PGLPRRERPVQLHGGRDHGRTDVRQRVTAINARASKHQTRQLNVASRRLSVRAGKRVTVTLLPSRAALALLTKFGRLPVQVRVTLASSKQTLNRSLVVRPANRKSRRV
ncbi:MAG TPA: hypothetical protein VG228_09015, partial [Solirubrobacteraceae bacterium]|nr:hypothetical protein [Solirubrobacteraceae bacterium]